MSWKASEMLMDTIKHWAGFPATGVSLRQMVQFGERPSTGRCPTVRNSTTKQLTLFAVKALYFEHLNFFPKNSLFAWRIEYKSSATYQMDSMICPQLRRFKNGMRNHSK